RAARRGPAATAPGGARFPGLRWRCGPSRLAPFAGRRGWRGTRARRAAAPGTAAPAPPWRRPAGSAAARRLAGGAAWPCHAAPPAHGSSHRHIAHAGRHAPIAMRRTQRPLRDTRPLLCRGRRVEAGVERLLVSRRQLLRAIRLAHVALLAIIQGQAEARAEAHERAFGCVRLRRLDGLLHGLAGGPDKAPGGTAPLAHHGALAVLGPHGDPRLGEEGRHHLSLLRAVGVGDEHGIMQGVDQQRLPRPVAEAEHDIALLQDLPSLYVAQRHAVRSLARLDVGGVERLLQQLHLLACEHHAYSSTSSRIHTGRSVSASSTIGSSATQRWLPYLATHSR